MLGHVPFRTRPWNRTAIAPAIAPTVVPTVVPTVAPTVAPAAPVLEPVAPRAPVADPVGIRVVPLRPASPWPPRTARQRVLNPFRSFPFRAMHLSRLMYAADAD